MDYKIGDIISDKEIVYIGKINGYSSVKLRCLSCNKIIVKRHYELKKYNSTCICKKIKYKNKDKNHIRLYSIYTHMKERCYNKNHVGYKNYGARGVSVCEEWKNDFLSFREWALQNGYSDNMTIDRIDNDLGYSPDNCQWITLGENVAKSNKNKQRRFADKKYLAISPDKQEIIFNNASKFGRENDLNPGIIRKYSLLDKEYKGWHFSRISK